MSGPSPRINAVASSSKPTFSHRENHSRLPHALTVRRPSSLRESRSADDLADDSEHEQDESDQGERERRLSVNVNLDVEASRCAGSGRKWSPEDSPVSDSSSDFDYEFDFDGTPGSGAHAATARSCGIDLGIDTSGPTSISISPPSPKIKSSGPTAHPYRRPQRDLAPLSSLPAPPPCANGVLPKSQPLARALFARMTDAPHAGMGLLGVGGGGGCAGKKAGQGKEKMIVATKPMRTTFELGLTASELARRP